jgi:regulator of protease activity HflC (stomatin/prohibitin superfamily)
MFTSITIIILAALAISLGFGIRTVNQQTIAIVETFGKYSRVLHSGLNFIFMPFQTIAGRLSLKIEPVPANVEVKTIDNMFVILPVNPMIRVDENRAEDAFYKLSDPHEQVRAWVLNTVRAISASMTLEEMYSDRERIVHEVKEDLSHKLGEYGYKLEAVLIDQPTVSQEVQATFNRVVAAVREKEAAVQEAQALQIRTETQARAEAEAQRERAKGMADSRKTIADSMRSSMHEFRDMDPFAVMKMLIDINRLDTLRELGRHGNLIILDLDKHGSSGSEALVPLLASLKRSQQTEIKSVNTNI